MTKLGLGDIGVWDRLWRLLDGQSEELVAYVYRVDSRGQVRKPYILRCEASPGLPHLLRDKLGGGSFQLLIKSGRTMMFSGRISVIETGDRLH